MGGVGFQVKGTVESDTPQQETVYAGDREQADDAGAQLVRGNELCVHVQSCLTLYNPTDCSPSGSSVHGIFQTRILVWVAISSSRGSSQPRDQIRISSVSCIAVELFTAWAKVHRRRLVDDITEMVDGGQIR